MVDFPLPLLYGFAILVVIRVKRLEKSRVL